MKKDIIPEYPTIIILIFDTFVFLLQVTKILKFFEKVLRKRIEVASWCDGKKLNGGVIEERMYLSFHSPFIITLFG